MEFIVQILNGMSVGSIYALVALGYSMVYGIVKLINFAHGEIIMLGGYAIYVSTLLLGLPVWLSVILSIAFCAIVGVAIEKLAYNRLLKKNAPRISLLITAIGVSIFLQNLMAQEWAFGSGSKPVNKLFNIPDLEIGGLKIEMLTVVTVLTTALLTVLPEALREVADYRMLVYAIVLILVMQATNNPTMKRFFASAKEKLTPGRKERAAL